MVEVTRTWCVAAALLGALLTAGCGESETPSRAPGSAPGGGDQPDKHLADGPVTLRPQSRYFAGDRLGAVVVVVRHIPMDEQAAFRRGGQHGRGVEPAPPDLRGRVGDDLRGIAV